MKRLIGTWQEEAALEFKRLWQEELPRLGSGTLGAALAAPEHSERLAGLAGAENP